METLKKLTLILFALLLGITVNASRVIRLSENEKQDVLYDVFIDEEEVIDLHNNTGLDAVYFKESVTHSYGHSSAPIYLKFFVSNDSDVARKYYFDLGNVLLEDYSVWDATNPKKLINIAYTKFALENELSVPAKTQKTFLVRFKDVKNELAISPVIYSEAKFVEWGKTVSLFDGLFYGALIFIFLYNLIFYLNIKQKFLLYYTCYVFFFGAFQFVFDGYFQHLIIDYEPNTNTLLVLVTVFSAYAFNFLFLKSFLDLRENLPRFNNVLKWFVVVLFMLVVTSLIEPLRIYILRLIDAVAGLSMLAILILAVVAFRKKIMNANLILISYSWIVLSGITFLLIYNGVLPNYEHRDYILKLGLIGELIILSIAASSSIYKVQLILRKRVADELVKSRKINSELIQAKKVVEETSKIKDQFMVNVSHEIRTPMNAVLGFTSMLEGFNLPDFTKEPIGNLKMAARGLMSAVEDILDFKQLTSKELECESKVFNLSQEIRYTLLTNKYSAKDKGLSFEETMVDACNEYYIGDSKKIVKLLNAVLNNAIKFTRTGGVKVLITKGKIESHVTKFKFQIKDTGIGIEESKLGLIFDSFYQVNSSYTRDFGGSGMGLALFKRLIKVMNGTYSVESVRGEGTVFTFEIELKNSKANPLNRQNINLDTEQQFSSLDKTINILSVEDDPINALIVSKYLKGISDKIILHSAVNGEEAISIVTNEKIDLILMDLQMPTMDGYEATRIIRNELPEDIASIPIIALTAHALDAEREKCFKFGMNEFVTKPYTKEELESVIVKYIDFEDAYKDQLDNLY